MDLGQGYVHSPELIYQYMEMEMSSYESCHPMTFLLPAEVWSYVRLNCPGKLEVNFVALDHNCVPYGQR